MKKWLFNWVNLHIHSHTYIHKCTIINIDIIQCDLLAVHFILFFERKFIGPLHWQTESSYNNSVSALKEAKKNFRSIRFCRQPDTYLLCIHIDIMHCYTHFCGRTSPAFRCQWHIVYTTMINWNEAITLHQTKKAVPRVVTPLLMFLLFFGKSWSDKIDQLCDPCTLNE